LATIGIFLPKRNTRWSPPIVTCLILGGLGIVGSIVSGGRATILMASLLVFLSVILCRIFVLVILSVCAMVSFVILANFFSDYINREMPYYFSRTLQLILIDKGSAFQSIEVSEEGRSLLRERALEEWMSTPRKFMLGRSWYGLT